MKLYGAITCQKYPPSTKSFIYEFITNLNFRVEYVMAFIVFQIQIHV